MKFDSKNDLRCNGCSVKECQSSRCRKHSSFYKVVKWAAHTHSLQKSKWDQDYSLEQEHWIPADELISCIDVIKYKIIFAFENLTFGLFSCLYRHKIRYNFLNHSKANTKWNPIIYKVKREIRWMKVLTSVVSVSWISLFDDYNE